MNDLTPFDYATLGSSADTLRAIAKSINSRMRTTAASIISIGRELRTAKGILGESVFGHWIEAEFGFTDRTARNYIAVVNQLGEYEDRISAIPASTLYLLASQSVPQEAIETVISRTEAGERIDRATAKEIIEESKDFVETVSTDEDELPQEDVEFDEPTNGIREPAASNAAPKPNIANMWLEITGGLERYIETYKRHCQECDEAAEALGAIEIALERHEYYVRNVEAV